jgi:alkyl hydroperoxide reductase subunit AhpC
MQLRLGDTVPNFTQASTHGDIDFYQWAGDSWVVLFSHPADFTPVCTTELGVVAKLSAMSKRSPSVSMTWPPTMAGLVTLKKPKGQL